MGWRSASLLVYKVMLIMFEFCSGRNPRRRILSTIIYHGCIRTLLGLGRRSEGGEWGLIRELMRLTIELCDAGVYLMGR
jgi:hypothetical protein